VPRNPIVLSPSLYFVLCGNGIELGEAGTAISEAGIQFGEAVMFPASQSFYQLPQESTKCRNRGIDVNSGMHCTSDLVCV
jgi:hypothetical protein